MSELTNNLRNLQGGFYSDGALDKPILLVAADRIEELEAREPQQQLDTIKSVVNEQAEDEGLWFDHVYITEDILQRALRRLHAAIESREIQEPWLPIETAPTDGTRILACSTKKKTVRVTWWRSKKDRAGYIGWGEFNTNLWPAEYWMPLPEPPQEAP